MDTLNGVVAEEAYTKANKRYKTSERYIGQIVYTEIRGEVGWTAISAISVAPERIAGTSENIANRSFLKSKDEAKDWVETTWLELTDY